MANLDIEFLSAILRLDAILRTAGWEEHRNWKLSAIREAQTLEDNGYDTVVSAILRGYNVNRESLMDTSYTDAEATRASALGERSWALFYPGDDTPIEDGSYTRDEAQKRARQIANREGRTVEIYDVNYGYAETIRPQ